VGPRTGLDGVGRRKSCPLPDSSSNPSITDCMKFNKQEFGMAPNGITFISDLIKIHLVFFDLKYVDLRDLSMWNKEVIMSHIK
jgi:hypothetical protein